MKKRAASMITGSLETTELTKSELSFFEVYNPGGLTLFGRNIDQENPDKLTQLCQQIQRGAETRRLVMIDQEGGRVARIKGSFPNPGPALEIEQGRVDETSLMSITDYGRRVGLELMKLGININFAPVVDILTESSNTAIGNRVWGTEAEPAIKRAGAWLTGLQSTGVWGCLKHFPGQGDAKVDTHLGEAIIDLPLDVLINRELLPFNALIDKVRMVMISHCVYPAWDHRPASLSPVIMHELLRKKLGFEGVVVSDDMTMGAIPSDPKSWTDAVIEAIANGADLILVCQKLELWRLAIDAVEAEARRSNAFDQILTRAADRVDGLRKSLIC